jgi:DNA-binding CsgD family transcriptional regulator
MITTVNASIVKINQQAVLQKSLLGIVHSFPGHRILLENDDSYRFLEEVKKLINEILNTSHFRAEIIKSLIKKKQLLQQLGRNERRFLFLCCTTSMPYGEIARTMHCSRHTIDGYRKRVFIEFSVHSREELMLFAIRNKLVNVLDTEQQCYTN